MKTDAPAIVAPSIDQLPLPELERVALENAAPSPSPSGAADPAPAGRAGGKKKPSGASRRGSLTPSEYKLSKADLAAEVRTLRAKLGAPESAATIPMSAAIDGRPGADHEKLAQKLGAIAALLAMIVFDAIAAWRGPTWAITETRADQLGGLVGDAMAYRLPDTISPADLAAYTAIGATAGLVANKLRQEREAKAAVQPAPAIAPAQTVAQPAATERPLFGSARR